MVVGSKPISLNYLVVTAVLTPLCYVTAAVCKNTAAVVLNHPVILTPWYGPRSWHMFRGVDITNDVHLCTWDNLATTIRSPFSKMPVLTWNSFWCREEASTAHVAGSSICENTTPPPSLHGNNTHKLCGWIKMLSAQWVAGGCLSATKTMAQRGSFVKYPGIVTLVLTTFDVKRMWWSRSWQSFMIRPFHIAGLKCWGCLHTDVLRMSVSTARVTGGCQLGWLTIWMTVSNWCTMTYNRLLCRNDGAVKSTCNDWWYVR
jgi:hypothetical protein